ncbi:hypothetical protein HY605_02050 [Candidatus Peregrinibacteria bacterium]|nr:hypothetical protein [Candidatus Peregrinibacteria bacterium]
MKKTLLILPFAAVLLFTACSSPQEKGDDENAEVARAYEETEERGSLYASVLQAKTTPEYSYWYECDSYGKCWDSEGWTWYDCYYNAFDPKCAAGSYWEPEAFGGPETDTSKDPATTPEPTASLSCCDSWGTCYNGSGEKYEDPDFLIADYYDECGNGYDYYGNYVGEDLSYKDDFWCSQYYQYDKVYDWDSCGNAYDATGNFLFYDNFYYDWQACNNDYSACEGSAIAPIDPIDPDMTGGIGVGDPSDPRYMVTDYVDECGNGYDYYGNYTEYDTTGYVKERCDEYYKYENVSYWDYCGNSFDKSGNFLFYDNFEYDYKNCDAYGYGVKSHDEVAIGSVPEALPDPSTPPAAGLDKPGLDPYADLTWTLGCDTLGTCKDKNGESYKDPLYNVTEYTDECGNGYDYYGNYTKYDATKYDKALCDKFYQYDKVGYFDECGNARDEQGNYLFYDNNKYDWKLCNGLK